MEAKHNSSRESPPQQLPGAVTPSGSPTVAPAELPGEPSMRNSCSMCSADGCGTWRGSFQGQGTQMKAQINSI